MKNQIITILFLSLANVMCHENDTNVENGDVASVGVVQGEASYVEILTDIEVFDNPKIEGEITSTGSAIPRAVSRTSIGSEFEFGPLPYGSYNIAFQFRDTLTGVLYKALLEDIAINASQISVFEHVVLEPRDQTVILATVVNSNNMPVSGASVFLYNDLNLLLKYPGTGAFLDSLQSSKIGKVAFIGHAPGEYFLFPRLVVEGDTLIADTASLTSADVQPGILNRVEVEIR